MPSGRPNPLWIFDATRDERYSIEGGVAVRGRERRAGRDGGEGG